MSSNAAPSPATDRVALALVSIRPTVVGADTFEGRIEATWADADATLGGIAALAPASAEAQLDVVCDLVWADGFEIEVAYPVRRGAAGWKPNLADFVRKSWAFYAGFLKPQRLTDDEYDAEVNSNAKRRDEATECLKRYALADPPPVTIEAPRKAEEAQYNPVAKNDLAHAQTFVGLLVLRCEGTGQSRKLAMELRKALAALNRCPDLLAPEA